MIAELITIQISLFCIRQNVIDAVDEYIKVQPPVTVEVSQGTIELNYIEALKQLNYFKQDSANDEVLNKRNAVLRFQSDNNLVVDGEWKEEETSVLKKRLGNQYFVYKDFVENAPTKDKWVVISKTKRILTLYEGDKVLNKYPVAQGKEPSYTPEGKFEIVNKAVNPSWGGGGYAAPIAGGAPNNPLGKRWIGISPEGGWVYGIHGNAAPYSIGTNVSRGCVRMINSDVAQFFELIEPKIPVWIGTDEKLQSWGVHQAAYNSVAK